MKCAVDGVPSLLLFHVPDSISSDGAEQVCFAIPMKFRRDGLLLCIPRGVVSEEALIQALSNDDGTSLVGPSKLLELALVEENENGDIIPLQSNSFVYAVDFSDDALTFLSEYDGTEFETSAPVAFSDQHHAALPDTAALCLAVGNWLSQQGSERVNFYSAREEQGDTDTPKASPKTSTAKRASAAPKRVSNAQVMETLSMMQEQLKVMALRQSQMEERVVAASADPALELTGGKRAQGFSLGKTGSLSLEGVPKAANLLGPPPKTKQPAEASGVFPAQADELLNPLVAPGLPSESGVVSAIAQQSTAIAALVSHLTQQSDPFADLQLGASSATSSTSTKGSQRRDRMHSDLANGTSNYYLAMMQQVHKRMNPGRPTPKSEAELASVSFMSYLEKTGGYRNAREAGLLMWLLGHIVDAASEGNLWLVRERLALTVVALEQSVTDGGDWSLAFLFSLAADPPLTLFQDKTVTVSPFGTPFSPLVPTTWSATVLAYVKELEILSTKKGETSPKKAKSGFPAVPDASDATDAAPKRRPRFPRKPKEGSPPSK